MEHGRQNTWAGDIRSPREVGDVHEDEPLVLSKASPRSPSAISTVAPSATLTQPHMDDNTCVMLTACQSVVLVPRTDVCCFDWQAAVVGIAGSTLAILHSSHNSRAWTGSYLFKARKSTSSECEHGLPLSSLRAVRIHLSRPFLRPSSPTHLRSAHREDFLAVKS